MLIINIESFTKQRADSATVYKKQCKIDCLDDRESVKRHRNSSQEPNRNVMRLGGTETENEETNRTPGRLNRDVSSRKRATETKSRGSIKGFSGRSPWLGNEDRGRRSELRNGFGFVLKEKAP